jgi:hypothetical protein
MLISIVGNDFSKKQKKTREVIAGLKIKRPDAFFSHMDSLDLDENKFEESLSTIGGLFEEKSIYWFSNIFRDIKLKNIFLEKLPEFQSSENAFVFSEDSVTPTELKTLEKHSFATHTFIIPKKDFDIFTISNAVQAKNKKLLWIEYHKALSSGLAVEQIYANIFYALKTITLAEKFSESDSGLKSFPYKKAKSSLSVWKKSEASSKLFSLVSIYNQSRLSGLPLPEALEKYILEL